MERAWTSKLAAFSAQAFPPIQVSQNLFDGDLTTEFGEVHGEVSRCRNTLEPCWGIAGRLRGRYAGRCRGDRLLYGTLSFAAHGFFCFWCRSSAK